MPRGFDLCRTDRDVVFIQKLALKEKYCEFFENWLEEEERKGFSHRREQGVYIIKVLKLENQKLDEIIMNTKTANAKDIEPKSEKS